MLSLHSMPLDHLAPELMTQLSAGAQIPTTQRLTRIDYLIVCRIQAVTSIKHYILAVTLLNIKINSTNLIVWGYMGCNWVGKLIEVQGKMDAEQYCENLEEGVEENFETLEMTEDGHYF